MSSAIAYTTVVSCGIVGGVGQIPVLVTCKRTRCEDSRMVMESVMWGLKLHAVTTWHTLIGLITLNNVLARHPCFFWFVSVVSFTFVTSSPSLPISSGPKGNSRAGPVAQFSLKWKCVIFEPSIKFLYYNNVCNTGPKMSGKHCRVKRYPERPFT